jgi:hypothetical protein
MDTGHGAFIGFSPIQPLWLVMKFPEPVFLNSFSIQSSSVAFKTIRAFNIEGSQNGNNLKIIENYIDQTNWGILGIKSYTNVPIIEAYTYIRLNIIEAEYWPKAQIRIQEVKFYVSRILSELNGFDNFYPIENEVLRLPYIAQISSTTNIYCHILSALDPIPQNDIMCIFDFTDFGDRSYNQQPFTVSPGATFSFQNTGSIYDNSLQMLSGTASTVLTRAYTITDVEISSFSDGYQIVRPGTDLSGSNYTFRIKYTIGVTPTVITPICGSRVLPAAYPPVAQTVGSQPYGFHLCINPNHNLIMFLIDVTGKSTSQVLFGGVLALNLQYDITIVIHGSEKLAPNNIKILCYTNTVLQTSTWNYGTIGVNENNGLTLGTLNNNKTHFQSLGVPPQPII